MNRKNDIIKQRGRTSQVFHEFDAGQSSLVVRNVTVLSSIGKTVLDNVSLTVGPADKIAIVGPEGSGKSTLLKFIAGVSEDNLDYRGSVEKSGNCGFLPQELGSEWRQFSVAEFLSMQSLDDPHHLSVWDRYADVRNALFEVGLPEEILEKEMGILSGGETVRVQLAKLLLQHPAILLLDEPTNNLDLSAIRWLEEFIKRSRAPVLFVSHDEELIRKASNAVLHMAHRSFDDRHFSYLSRENYDSFRERLLGAATAGEGEKSSIKREIRRLKIDAAERQNRASGAASYAAAGDAAEKGRMMRGAAASSSSAGAASKKLTKLQKELDEFVVPYVGSEARFEFPAECAVPTKKLVLDIDSLELSAGAALLSRAVSLQLVGPERVGIIGDNGVGKTSLLREICRLPTKSGIRLGYMPQDFDEVLPSPYNSAVDMLEEAGASVTDARTRLSNMGFTRSEMLAGVGTLSGGQRGKIILLLLVFRGANLLILDEPTRNLSPVTAPVLRQQLVVFPGCILVVSHDRRFLREVCTRVLQLGPSGLTDVDMQTL